MLKHLAFLSFHLEKYPAGFYNCLFRVQIFSKIPIHVTEEILAISFFAMDHLNKSDTISVITDIIVINPLETTEFCDCIWKGIRTCTSWRKSAK